MMLLAVIYNYRTKTFGIREPVTEFQSSGPPLSGRATSSVRQALIAATATKPQLGKWYLRPELDRPRIIGLALCVVHTHHISLPSGLSSSLSLSDTDNLRGLDPILAIAQLETSHCSSKTLTKRPLNLNQIYRSHHGETLNPDTAHNPPCHCRRGWIHRIPGSSFVQLISVAYRSLETTAHSSTSS